MKNILMLSIMIFSAIQLVAQDSETRQFENFNSIEVGEAIELIITQGSKNEAVIQVDGIDLDEVITEVNRTELNVKRRNSGRNNNNNRGEVVVRLTYRELDELSVNSAASVFSKSVIKSNDFEIKINSAGSADLELDVINLEVELSSAGSLDVSGRCSSLDLDASSAGNFDGYDLMCGSVKADMNSGGSGKVSVKDRLEVDAGSGGSLYYKGDPDKVLADTNLGGRVQRR